MTLAWRLLSFSCVAFFHAMHSLLQFDSSNYIMLISLLYISFCLHYLFYVHGLEVWPLAPLIPYQALSCIHGLEMQPLAPPWLLTKFFHYTSYHQIHVSLSVFAICHVYIDWRCSIFAPQLLARICSLLSFRLFAEEDLAPIFRRHAAVQIRASTWGGVEEYISISLPLFFSSI